MHCALSCVFCFTKREQRKTDKEWQTEREMERDRIERSERERSEREREKE